MATNDTELISEVRALTGYNSTNTFTDSDIQALIDIGKDEIISELGVEDTPTWYSQHDRTRALFWFTCIALKIKDGEIGSADISLESMDVADSSTEYDVWFRNLDKRLRQAAAVSGSLGGTTTQIERTGRSYSFDRPQ